MHIMIYTKTPLCDARIPVDTFICEDATDAIMIIAHEQGPFGSAWSLVKPSAVVRAIGASLDKPYVPKGRTTEERAEDLLGELVRIGMVSVLRTA